jgi:hypothetical protein
MLKKEFTQKDVQRARNLITGQVDAATSLQTGYERGRVEHKEGDIWEESGRKWTIKNGIRQTVTKFDSLKQLTVLPLCCPECEKPMKVNNLNKKMYSIHNKCFDCVIEMESQLKATGRYQEYERRMLNGNKNGILEDLERALDAWIVNTDTIMSEDGVAEDWSKVKVNPEDYQGLRGEIKKAKEQEI